MTEGKRFVPYEVYGSYVNQLVKKIQESGQPFDCIYTAARGGWPVAVHLSHYLGIPIRAVLEDRRGKRNPGRVLIVDDISHTGATLIKMRKYASEQGWYHETACVFVKTGTRSVPAFHMGWTVEWIVFPWETGEEEIGTRGSL